MHRFSGLELRSLSINTSTQFIVRLLGSFATLITTLLIAYFLGLEYVGSFTKVVGFVSLFYLFLDFGFNSVLLKTHFNDLSKNIGNLIVLRLGIALILIPVIGILALLLPHNEIAGTGFSEIEKTAISVFSLGIVGISLFNSLQVFLQKNLMYKKAVLPSFASSVFLLVIVLYGIYTFNFLLIFFAYVFSWILQAALLFLILKTESNLSLSTHNFLPFMKGLIAASWPLGLMLIFNLLYSRSDVVLLSLFQPTADVGVYGVSYRFFEIGLALPTFLANSTYPLLLKNKDNTRNYMTLFRKYIFLYIVLSLVTTILAFVFSPLIGFFKNGFQLSILPLQLLTLSLPFFFLTSLLQWHFLIRNKLKFLIPLYAAILVINLTLNMLLIPRFSYYAAAATTVLCEGLVFAIMLWHFIRSSKQSA